MDAVDAGTGIRIMTLLGAFTALLDAGRSDEWAELFTDAGSFEVGERSFAGHAVLRAFAAQSTRGVHLTGLPLIEPSRGGVTALSPFIFVAAADGRTLSGRYLDDIALDGGDARFARRRVEIVRSAPGDGGS
ncbi:MAG: nuclear transport factor 2 family protein [Microbacterium sp.]